MRLDAEDLMEDSKLKVNRPKGHNNTINGGNKRYTTCRPNFKSIY